MEGHHDQFLDVCLSRFGFVIPYCYVTRKSIATIVFPKTIFSLLSLCSENKMRLMRSRRCLCVYIPPIFFSLRSLLYQRKVSRLVLPRTSLYITVMIFGEKHVGLQFPLAFCVFLPLRFRCFSRRYVHRKIKLRGNFIKMSVIA